MLEVDVCEVVACEEEVREGVEAPERFLEGIVLEGSDGMAWEQRRERQEMRKCTFWVS